MKIQLKCLCGSELYLEDSTYIRPSRLATDDGMVYIIELRAKEWLDMHRECLSKINMGKGE